MTAPHISRRNALSLLGAAGAAVVGVACSKSSNTSTSATTSSGGSGGVGATASSGIASGATATTAATDATSGTNTCTLSPEMTEGPYYIDGEAIREDITEGRPGTPLRLVLTVVDVDACKALPSAQVEIWHADAEGNYSGFNATASNRTFLRGVQVAGSSGVTQFKTIYPGWYQGRATHIHLKVHVSGNTVHTGQLFFDEATNEAVYAAAPYTGHSGRRTTNAQDGIYSRGGAQSLVALKREGEGYVGTITLGVQS